MVVAKTCGYGIIYLPQVYFIGDIMNVWVLTTEYNEYDQYGEYFVAVFKEIPHRSQLTAFGVPQNRLRHVLNGGGRIEFEHQWFFLRIYNL